MSVLFIIAGLFVGFLIGLTGVGGGAVMTPLLIFGFSVAPVIAVGTDLLFAAVTKFFGVFFHHNAGAIEWRVVALMAAGSVPAALVTTTFLHEINGAGGVDKMITTGLGIALIFTSFSLFFKKKVQEYGKQWGDGLSGRSQLLIGALTVIVGAALGVMVTITSVGAGALGVAILFFLYPRLPTVKVVGTDIAHAVLLTTIAGLGHFSIGSVNLGLLGQLLLGSIPGIYIGARLSTKVPEDVLRPVLAVMLLLVGVRFAVAA